MSHTLQLGAIDIETNMYFSPSEALKGRDYKCNECGNRVILRKGEVRKPHFAHHSQTNTCSYYDHPSESQIHKDAKELMKKLITEKNKIQFVWECDYPPCYKTLSNINAFSEVPTIAHKEGDEVVLEYRDPENRWIADVAVVNGGKVRYIIEIKHTHGTSLGRPEPWFEVDATLFIQSINNQMEEKIAENITDYIFSIGCERKNIHRYCYGSFCYRESWVNKIPGYTKGACLLCKTHDFTPVSDGCTGKFQKFAISVCIDCLAKDTYEKKIPAKYQPRCDGSCFIQGNDGNYNQGMRRYCTQSCMLIKCLKCPKFFPKIFLDCYGGVCKKESCSSYEDVLAKYFFVYLNVPFAKKEEAKALGAKWDSEKKKWYIEKDSKQLSVALSKFG
jgi:hypothetical protein